MDKPQLNEVRMAKETLKRWFYVAKERQKAAAMKETMKLYKMIEYLEEFMDKNHL